MAEKKAPAKKISLSNTKQEMLEAYNETLKQLQEKRELDLQPKEKVEQKEKQQVVAVADALSTEGIVQSMSQLKGEIGRMLGQLSDRLEDEVARYRQISRAVEVKEAELQEIYDIQKSASSLAALIEAQHQKRFEVETRLAEETSELEAEIQSGRIEWEQERKRHEAEIKERDAIETKRREREKEDYLYTFKRERQLAADQFEDEKSRLEREIQIKRDQTELELTERENAVAIRELEANTLKSRVDTFPQELESRVATAVHEAVERLQSESASREELLRKEFEGERNVLNTRIESLLATVKEQHDQIARLSQQTDKAYGQVQTMAVKVIEGASQLQSLSSLQQIVADQGRKPAPEK